MPLNVAKVEFAPGNNQPGRGAVGLTFVHVTVTVRSVRSDDFASGTTRLGLRNSLAELMIAPARATSFCPPIRLPS